MEVMPVALRLISEWTEREDEWGGRRKAELYEDKQRVKAWSRGHGKAINLQM